jgi:hypothetical protein
VCLLQSNAVQLIEFTGQASHELNLAQQDQRCMSSR